MAELDDGDEQAFRALTSAADDDTAVRALASLLDRQAPPPPSIIALGIEAWSWRDPDAQIATLLHDSSAGTGVTAGLRSGPAVDRSSRAMSFELEHDGVVIDIDVQIESGRDGATIMGQVGADDPIDRVELLAPATSGRSADVGRSASRLTAAVDALGRFRFDAVRATTIRLRVETATRTTITPWITL